MWKQFNNNPVGRSVGDCAVRAASVALEITWEDAFARLAVAAFNMGDVISANSVLGAVLRQNGFYRKSISDTCPDCYTFGDFDSGTEFSRAIDGKDAYAVWEVMDELLSVLQATNPRLFDGVMRKIEEI